MHEFLYYSIIVILLCTPVVALLAAGWRKGFLTLVVCVALLLVLLQLTN